MKGQTNKERNPTLVCYWLDENQNCKAYSPMKIENQTTLSSKLKNH